MKGKLIVIEGIDGCGKDTVQAILANHLMAEGYNVVCEKEPTDKFAKFIHEDFKDMKGDPYLTPLLFTTDRAYHNILMRNEINEGKIILCNRYLLSTLCYQPLQYENQFYEIGNYKRYMDWLESINKNFIIPDVTIYLNVDPEVALQRINKRNKEIVEKYENSRFLKELHNSYIQNLIRYEKYMGKIIKVDTNKPVDDIIISLKDLVLEYLREEKIK